MVAGLLAAPVLAGAPVSSSSPPPAPELLHSVDEPTRQVLERVLEHAPELIAARARAAALGQAVDAAGRLPDPSASLTAFALPVETRVGAQRLSVSARQALPRPEARRLERRRAELRAAQAEADVDAATLRALTRARILLREMDGLRHQIAILEDQALHLASHEESARARYAAGQGLAADPIRLQAALTTLDTETLTLESRLAAHGVELARLTGWWEQPPPQDETDIDALDAGASSSCELPDGSELLRMAETLRPEIRHAELTRQAADVGTAQVEESFKPSFSVGLLFTAVESRDDAAARLNPPAGNGDDILALTGGVTVPLWRKKNEARVAAATAESLSAGAVERSVRAEVRRQVEEPLARLPALCRQVSLLDGVLLLQAEEAVRSAVAGYAAGTLGALALLDAEHRLFEVRSAAVAAATARDVAHIRLEGAVGAPLASLKPDIGLTGDTEEIP